MILPTIRQWPLPVPCHERHSILGLLLALTMGSLTMPGPPTALGQLIPAAENRLPGQPLPQAGLPQTGTAADRARPLVAYHRDQQEPDIVQPDARQPATVPHPRDHQSVRHQGPKPTDHALVPSAPSEFPVKMPENFLTSATPARAEATEAQAALARHDADHARRLLPTAGNSSYPPSGAQRSQQNTSDNRSTAGRPHAFPSLEVLRTAGTGLGISLGLLLLCAWLFRRNAPSSTTPLPKEVVSVLGRVPLAARHFVQLLRVGNKLVLVSVTAEGTETITEVTDPVEVDRLLSLCMRNHTQSTTAEFQQVLNQLSREGAKGFLDK